MESEQKKSKGQFFGMSMNAFKTLVEVGAGAEELMAYIVLARGASKRGDKLISTHGANSVSNRTGISYSRAEKALAWLIDNMAITSLVEKSDTPIPKKLHAKYQINDVDLDVYLANTVTDGIGEGKKNPPLMRIYNHISICSSGLLSDARLDALVILVNLYKEQDMNTYGGVSPYAIYQSWTPAETALGEKVRDIEDTNASLYEIKRDSQHVFHSFADSTLFYVDNSGERYDRFWSAFSQLRTFGFVYEVTQIWSADPHKDKKAEPLYTLYINDYHARQSDPYLQSKIHSLALNNGAMDCLEFSEIHDDDYSVMNSGRFRYIGTRNGKSYPIGIYRLRFRASTKDTGSGIEAETHRFNEWAKVLKSIHY